MNISDIFIRCATSGPLGLLLMIILSQFAYKLLQMIHMNITCN